VHSYTDTAKDLSAQRLQSRILALNGWIKAFALKSNLVFVDYFSALVDDQGLMKKERRRRAASECGWLQDCRAATAKRPSCMAIGTMLTSALMDGLVRW